MLPPPPNPCIARPLSIDGVRLATNLLLAPVANYCDLAWRIVCREQGGVGLACTDLLSPHGLLRGAAQSLDLAMTNDEDRPVCMQLYGGEPDILAEGAVWAVKHGATIIDINMGCPVDKVTKKDGGSKLLCDPARTVKLAARVVSAVSQASRGAVPVTAKLRLGWTDDCLVAPDLAVDLCKAGIAAITVHGRTTQQMFKGEVNRPGIRAVVQAVQAAFGTAEAGGIPVIGNGDVTEPWHALRMMNETGCAGVMIGRGSFSRPWIFHRAWGMQCASTYPDRQGGAESTPAPTTDDPSEAEKLDIIRRYFDLMLRFRDERYALNNIRRRISWMGKALGPCKPLKERIRTSPDPAAVHAAIDEFGAGGLRTYAGVQEPEEVEAA